MVMRRDGNSLGLGLLLIALFSTNLSAQSPGDSVGFAHQHFQVEGNRIALDNDSGVHFIWMSGPSGMGIRCIRYNYYSPSGEWLFPYYDHRDSIISSSAPQISVTTSSIANIAFINYDTYVTFGRDMASGFGVFEFYDPPDMLQHRCYWPNLTVDIQDRVHIVSTEENPGGDLSAVAYTQSDDQGLSWETLQVVDTVSVVSARVTSSPVSERVAIFYSHPIDNGTVLENDIYYVLSEDGVTWDFLNGKVNVTGYGGGDDSLFTDATIDAVFDYDDNLHLIWTAHYLSDNGYYPTTYLYHFEIDSGTMTQVTSLEFEPGPDCLEEGTGNAIRSVSLAAGQQDERLFAVYTGITSNDCSADGYANGELFLQESYDDGLSWTNPINLTNTSSPNCQPGGCLSEEYPSLAERADGFIHVFYVCNLRWEDDEVSHADPQLYLRHQIPTGIPANEIIAPNSFLLKNSPNPFNPSTTISYSMAEQGQISISIYNLLGQRVATLLDGFQQAGEHSLIWDASAFPSGVYFARLEGGKTTETIKMVFLK
jgi:hypothetical protein